MQVIAARTTPKNIKDKVSGESAKEEMLTTGSNGLKKNILGLGTRGTRGAGVVTAAQKPYM